MSRHTSDQLEETAVGLTSLIGPFSAWLAERLQHQAARCAAHACLDLLDFARRYSPPRVEAAIARMMSFNVEDLATLRFLLAHDLDLLCRSHDADLDGQLHLPYDELTLRSTPPSSQPNSLSQKPCETSSVLSAK